MDCRDRDLERPIVEDRAVDERRRRRVDVGLQMLLELSADELLPARPGGAPLRDQLVHLHDLRRRKGARKGRGGARRKGEAGRIVQPEIAFHLAVGPPPIAEAQHVVMLQLVNERRIVDLDELPVAVIVGERDEQIQGVAGRQQRSAGALGAPSR